MMSTDPSKSVCSLPWLLPADQILASITYTNFHSYFKAWRCCTHLVQTHNNLQRPNQLTINLRSKQSVHRDSMDLAGMKQEDPAPLIAQDENSGVLA